MKLLEQTQQLCRQYHIVPSRSKGQNFLIDEEAYEAMISAAELSGDETVLEIGPGLGFLTERLAKRTQKVFAVELDDKLAPALRARLSKEGIANVEIYNEDILNFTNSWAIAAASIGDGLAVVANLPYNISSLFLRKFLAGNEGNILPQRLTLMLQKEVAERIVARPGDMSLLSVSAQFYTEPKITAFVPASSFWPAPKVGSAVVTLKRSDRYQKRLASLGLEEKIFFRVAKIAFSARRKMLKANLSAGLKLPVPKLLQAMETAGIQPKARAQEVSLDQWLKLVAALQENIV